MDTYNQQTKEIELMKENKSQNYFNYDFFNPEIIETRDLHEDRYEPALDFSVTIYSNVLERKGTKS